MNRRANRQGFTLIELLVAIGVVVILVAILLPAVARAKDRARHAATMSMLRDIEVSLDHYGSDFGMFPEDGNTAMKTRLEEREYRSWSSKELLGAQVIDAWGRSIYYDEVQVTGFNHQGNGDIRGEKKNRDYDIWSLGASSTKTLDDIANWRQ